MYDWVRFTSKHGQVRCAPRERLGVTAAFEAPGADLCRELPVSEGNANQAPHCYTTCTGNMHEATDRGHGPRTEREPTRQDAFLATMDQNVSWAELCSMIEPHYPKGGNGRPTVGLKRVPRMYFALS